MRDPRFDLWCARARHCRHIDLKAPLLKLFFQPTIPAVRRSSVPHVYDKHAFFHTDLSMSLTSARSLGRPEATFHFRTSSSEANGISSITVALASSCSSVG